MVSALTRIKFVTEFHTVRMDPMNIAVVATVNATRINSCVGTQNALTEFGVAMVKTIVVTTLTKIVVTLNQVVHLVGLMNSSAEVDIVFQSHSTVMTPTTARMDQMKLVAVSFLKNKKQLLFLQIQTKHIFFNNF